MGSSQGQEVGGELREGLRVDGVTVRFGANPVVDDVSFCVEPGEVLALLGASGSGKSTILRAISGLEPLARGSVSWNGEDLALTPVHKRRFALMFQDGQLFAHRSVFDNVAYAPRIAGATDLVERVDRLLDLVDLAGYASRAVGSLSGGEQQRVALARALAAEPRLLLLDEPLSSLDRELRERLAADLRTILTDTGTTAIFVTHDQDEALAIADRVAIVQRGRLVQVGEPASVWRNPATPAVARFLGYTSILEPDAAALIGLEGTVALRPDALVVDPSGSIDAIASRDAPTSRGVRLRVRVEGVGVLDAVATGERRYAQGYPVRLRVDRSAIAQLQ